MTTENPFPWADGMNCAVTVCDTEGVILYMNEKARATYIRHGNLIGSNLFGCHNERSREIIRRLTAEGVSVVVFTSDILELIGLSDEIYVMYEGEISGHIAGAEATEEKIMQMSAKSANKRKQEGQ